MSWRQEAEKTASNNAVNNPGRARANNPASGFFSAGGAEEISRWRHHRNPIAIISASRQGRRTWYLLSDRCRSGAPSGRKTSPALYRWWRHRLISSAPPAQNLRMSHWPMLPGLALRLDIADLLRRQTLQKIPRRRAVKSRIARLDAEEETVL